MGWTQFTMHEPIAKWFKDQWSASSDYECIECSLVKFHTIYGAIRIKKTGEVFCAVYLVRWGKGYQYNFSYKDMSEFSGPGVRDCPEKIYKLLTPLTDENDPNGWAREWRKRVEEYHIARKVAIKGNLFKTHEPVHFAGRDYQYFKRLKFADGHPNQKYYPKSKNLYAPYIMENNELTVSSRIVRFDPSYYSIEIVT